MIGQKKHVHTKIHCPYIPPDTKWKGISHVYLAIPNEENHKRPGTPNPQVTLTLMGERIHEIN